jgi:hypothetical protein
MQVGPDAILRLGLPPCHGHGLPIIERFLKLTNIAPCEGPNNKMSCWLGELWPIDINELAAPAGRHQGRVGQGDMINSTLMRVKLMLDRFGHLSLIVGGTLWPVGLGSQALIEGWGSRLFHLSCLRWSCCTSPRQLWPLAITCVRAFQSSGNWELACFERCSFQISDQSTNLVTLDTNLTKRCAIRPQSWLRSIGKPETRSKSHLTSLVAVIKMA